MNDKHVQLFIQLIATSTGLHIRPQDWEALSQKVATRMKALKLFTVEKYYQLLESNTEQSQREWRELIVLLTTNESYFLRDKGQFKLLEQVILPQIIEQKNQLKNAAGVVRSLRIWSAGCSTGEEPYSLAILIQKLIPDWQNWNILVLGTDINEEALEKAKQGIYRTWSFRLVHPGLQEQYFNKHKSGWAINTKLVKNVKFRYGNLVKDDYPNIGEDIYNMDLILCRNVFVYFESQYIALVLKKFYNTLRAGGYLLTGHAELHGQVLGQFRANIFPESVVYQRSELGQEAHSSNPLYFSNIEEAISKSRQRLAELDISHSAVTKLKSAGELTYIQPKTSQIGGNSPLSAMLPPPSFTAEKERHLPVQTLLREAEQSFNNKAYDEAIKKAEQVIDFSPGNFEAYYLLAKIYANLGKYVEAINYCQAAIKVDSMSVFPYYLLAHIADEKGDLEDAKLFLKKIIYLCPSFISAYIELGNIYNREGDVKRARKMYDTSCEILKTLPPDTLIEQHGKMTANELLRYVKEVSLKLSVQ